MNGILLALRDRDRTGQGQHVDIALLDAMTSALALPAGIYFNTGEEPGREGNQHHTLTPYETIEVADGLVVVAAGNERLWRQLCTAIGAGDLEAHPDYATNTDRMAHRRQLIAELTPRLARYTRDALIKLLRAHKVPCAQVRTIGEALEDPHLRARGMVVDMPHDGLGTMRSLGNPIRLSRTPAAIHRRPPALGEHNEEILESLGTDDDSRTDPQPVGAITRGVDR